MKFFEITSSKDQEEYEVYKNIRGPLLYEFVAEYCCQKLNLPVVNYQLVRDIIVYDKRLKDNLYVFLGTYEDYLKAEIALKTSFCKDGKTFSILKDNEANDGTSFNQISNNSYTLFGLEKEFKKLDLLKDYPNLHEIKKFRNKVMHFNFLLFKKENNEFKCCLKELEESIQSLKNGLPDSYRKKFLERINNTKKNLNGEFNNQINEFLMEDLK